MATRWARVVRGLVASLLAAFVAGFAHVIGGGSMPGLAGVAMVLALCVPASILLAGRTISTLRLAIAVSLSQGAFHLLFSLTSNSSAGVLPHAAARLHEMTGMPGMPGSTGMPGVSTVLPMADEHGASVVSPMMTSG